MAKARTYYMRLVPLILSLLIYVPLIMNVRRFGERGLSWSRRAAAEAESVAALRCSGHGRAFLDGLLLDDEDEGSLRGPCECNSCYRGPDCSEFLPECEADANQGDPLFLEPFWMMNPKKSAIMLSGWHRMSYYHGDRSYTSKRLENTIRKLHSVVGNAVTEGRYVLYGSGSTQLLNAAIHALSSGLTAVVASIPHYEVFGTQTKLFKSKKYDFRGDATPWINNTNDDIIEIVTSPSNPIGELKDPTLNATRGNARTIHDRAYYWPHYTAIPAPADEDLVLFTISRLTGHAGSRFGWALIKDEKVYQRMSEYLELNTVGVSRDTQLRMLKILNVVIEDKGRRFFEFGHGTMNRRWKALKSLLSDWNRFSLQRIPPRFCTYFDEQKEPTPAYAWLKCEEEEQGGGGKSCHQVLMEAKIIGRQGSLFKSDDQHVRLSLIRSEDDFEMLVRRLRQLIDRERRIGNEVSSGLAKLV